MFSHQHWSLGTKINDHGCISLDKAVVFDFISFVCLFLLSALLGTQEKDFITMFTQHFS